MYPAVFFVWCSSLLVVSTTITLLVFFSDIYYDMKELAGLLNSELDSFRMETDESWKELLDVQILVTPPRRRRNMQDDFADLGILHRLKVRQTQQQSSFPPFCQCEPQRPRCTPGPRGPQGSQGAPGAPGERGPRGQDNFKSYPAVDCSVRDIGCIRCPAGSPGFPGPPGKEGIRGPPGLSGSPGYTPKRGARGPPGPSGNQGRPGLKGDPGSRGPPGRNGVIPVRNRGSKGPRGNPGKQGKPGKPGVRAQDGLPGAMGPTGKPGRGGERGKPGQPGVRGAVGPPGRDAAYCTCPKRTLLFLKNSKT